MSQTHIFPQCYPKWLVNSRSFSLSFRICRYRRSLPTQVKRNSRWRRQWFAYTVIILGMDVRNVRREESLESSNMVFELSLSGSSSRGTSSRQTLALNGRTVYIGFLTSPAGMWLVASCFTLLTLFAAQVDSLLSAKCCTRLLHHNSDYSTGSPCSSRGRLFRRRMNRVLYLKN